jgi:hypothetical protein
MIRLASLPQTINTRKRSDSSHFARQANAADPNAPFDLRMTFVRAVVAASLWNRERNAQ